MVIAPTHHHGVRAGARWRAPRRARTLRPPTSVLSSLIAYSCAHWRRRRSPDELPHPHLSKADVTELEEQYVLEAVRSGWVAPTRPDGRPVRGHGCRAGRVLPGPGPVVRHRRPAPRSSQPRRRAGRVVLVPSMTFAASVNAVLYTGAELVLVDSERRRRLRPRPPLLLSSLDTLLDARRGCRGCHVRGPVRAVRGLLDPRSRTWRGAVYPWSRMPPRHSAPATAVWPRGPSAVWRRCPSTATRS